LQKVDFFTPQTAGFSRNQSQHFRGKIPTKIQQDTTYPHHCYRIFTVIDRAINKTRNKDKNIYTPICKKKITKKINIFYKRFAHIKKK
jgi:hypothetical protein